VPEGRVDARQGRFIFPFQITFFFLFTPKNDQVLPQFVRGLFLITGPRCTPAKNSKLYDTHSRSVGVIIIIIINIHETKSEGVQTL
jgi:hypothetical protein